MNAICSTVSSEKGASCTKQSTLHDCEDRVKKYSRDSSRWLAITDAVAMMIYNDCQPFSVVENKGFKKVLQTTDPKYDIPSRQHMSNAVIPRLYENKKTEVKDMISSLLTHCTYSQIALSTDTWTSKAVDLYISMIAHYIDNSWIKHRICLDTCPLTESHTAEHLRTTIEQILEDWGIGKVRVSCCIRDNAANISKALRDSQITSIGCFDHTLQLCVNSAISHNDDITNLLKEARGIVTHFHKSTTARATLNKFQVSLGLPENEVIQEVCTRWNSTFAMVERLVDQRQAIMLHWLKLLASPN